MYAVDGREFLVWKSLTVGSMIVIKTTSLSKGKAFLVLIWAEGQHLSSPCLKFIILIMNGGETPKSSGIQDAERKLNGVLCMKSIITKKEKDKAIAKQVYERLVGVEGVAWIPKFIDFHPDNAPDYKVCTGHYWLCEKCISKGGYVIRKDLPAPDDRRCQECRLH